MDVRIECYLETIERQLKAIQDSERADIMSEIRSRIEEKRYFEEGSSEDILISLGDPHDLALTYLAASINRAQGLSIRRFLMVLSFLTARGSSGSVALPLVSMVSIGCIAAGIIVPIVGLIDTGSFLINNDTANLMARFGPLPLHPMLVFPVSLLFGAFLVMGGIAIWRLMVKHGKTRSGQDTWASIPRNIV